MNYVRLVILSIVTSLAVLPAPHRAVAAENSVAIDEVSPDPSKPLKVGEEVKFKAKVRYVLSEPTGTVSLVIQRGEHSGGIDASLGSTMEVITKGEGTVSLEQAIKVPDTKSIQIFAPLSGQRAGPTTTVDARFYKVER